MTSDTKHQSQKAFSITGAFSRYESLGNSLQSIPSSPKHLPPQLPLNIEPMIDDTTLRDGVQTPGIALSPEETLEVAFALDRIGVQRIELHHFQMQDKKAIKLIQDASPRVRLAGWCRAVKDDIDSALACDFKEIGISHPVSKIHMETKWPNKSEEELLERVVGVVEYAAKDHDLTVFVHGEDSTRADWDFEETFITACSEAGATTYRICDTLGIGNPRLDAPLPNGIPEKVRMIRLKTKVPSVEIHAHNDLGNALANTLAAVSVASGHYKEVYASTTLLGIGERAGNAKTEEVMMNLYYHYGITNLEKSLLRITEASRCLSKATGIPIPINHPIVGGNAFTHESGIHTHGILRNPKTYESFPPELVGNSRRLTVGKHSGRSIIRHKIASITGREEVDTQLLDTVVNGIKGLYENGRRSSLNDREIQTLIQHARTESEST
jgi:isopropylmalate/homocitrate/citramalate synthase